MEIRETVECTEDVLDELKTFGEADGNSVSRQIEIALVVYLRMRNSPIQLQNAIFGLLNNPAKYKIDNDSVKSLDLLSQIDGTTVHQQAESAITMYLSIRSLPDKAGLEITNLIAHHVSRNNDDGK